MAIIKNIIFGLFGAYEKVNDINKDANGKGTLERYNEVVGKYADEELTTNVNAIVANNLDPVTALYKFVPYLENRIGVNLLIYNTEEWRRRVLKHYMKWVLIRSTRRAYELLFGMLGLSVTVTVDFSKYGFDSPLTFDDDVRHFDMSTCNACVDYTVDLIGTIPMTDETIAAIYSIIKWNEPINAHLKGVTYNGTTLEGISIQIWIDDNGDLVYNNDYDSSTVVSLTDNGDLIFSGPNANRYSMNDTGDVIFLM